MPSARTGATSYRDPSYDAIDRSVEEQLKLPVGMLASIRLKGERSNADQVSSAGARTVYQVTPTTRDLVLNKYGVDAYAGPQQAAMAAGHLLREGLDRNGGSRRAAVAEYHGGTDRRNHGPITDAYVRRVAGDGQSTFDRVTARRAAEREAESGPSLAKVYAAYRQGRMSNEQAAQFEHDVNAGAILLPPGGKLKKAPAAPLLPAGVVRAYNDLNSGMTVEQRQQVDSDLRDGVVSLPRAAKLNPWRPMTTAENASRGLGLGVRSVIEGAGDVAGMVLNPINTALNATGIPQRLTGKPLAMANDPSINIADKLGLPKPQFDGEKMVSAAERGAMGGLVTSGLGAAASALPGAAGAIGRAVASAPVTDLVSGAAAGGAAEGASQAGFGPTGQFVAGLVGGGAGIAGGLAAERGAARIANRRPVAELPSTTPREVVLDRTGELTEEGQELVARHGFTPDEIKRAYAETGTPTAKAANPVPQPARPIAEGARPPEADAATAGGDRSLVRTSAAQEVAPPSASPASVAPATIDDAMPSSAPSANPQPGGRTAADRIQEAEALGIPLTRGQAMQDFAVQDGEQTLRAQASGEGEKARTFLVDQAEKIRAATTQFREAFGAADITKAERGRIVVDALRELRDRGKAGISALYREAEEMGGGGLSLETDGIADAAKRALVEADVPDGVKNVIRQEMARYGMIGKKPVTAEDGLTTVTLTDGRKVQFYGDPEPLTVGNAELFRKAISAQYPVDGPRKLSQGIKGAVDDAVEAAVEAAARKGVDGPVGQKLREARQAVVTQKETFSAKDVVQKLIDWKKGTRTDNMLPEQAIREVLSGEVSNLGRIKTVLLTKPTATSKAAWRAVQAEGIGGIIDKAYTANANLGGGPAAAISGAKLNSEIIRFGIPKLKILLDEPDFNRLMSLRRVIGEATIPIAGTTNPSGSAFKLMRFLAPMAVKFSSIPLAGPAIDVASSLVKQAKATAEARSTLDGMTRYTSTRAAREAATARAGSSEPSPTSAAADERATGLLDALAQAGRDGRLTSAVLASANEAVATER